MIEDKIKSANSILAAGIAALALAIGSGGCMSSHRVPVYGPNGAIHSNVSCFSLLPSCGGDSYKKNGPLELDGGILYETCYCYDPTPPRSTSTHEHGGR